MISQQASLTHQIKILLIFTILVLTSACSFKTLYNQLDYLIPSYLEDMVSLGDVLEEKVEQRVQLLINWHRNTQLNEYADWLRSLRQDVVATDLTEKKLLQHIARLEYFWKSLLHKLNDEMADLLPSLNSEQRKELYANIIEKNQNFRDDYIDVNEKKRIDSYVERMVDNYENWLGDLNDEQKKSIEQAAKEIRSVARLRLKQRSLWQQGIQKILDSNETTSLTPERLRTFFAGFEMNKSSEMEKLEAVNRRIMVQLTLKIVHGLTPDQKEHFISQTNDYIRIFTELSENR